jgi:UDP-2,3-diacylglucosamine hydrolase
VYLGDDKEYLMLYAKEKLQQDSSIDYFILGHRHYPFDKKIGNSHVINLGDWMQYNTYVVYDGKTVELKKYEG